MNIIWERGWHRIQFSRFFVEIHQVDAFRGVVASTNTLRKRHFWVLDLPRGFRFVVGGTWTL